MMIRRCRSRTLHIAFRYRQFETRNKSSDMEIEEYMEYMSEKAEVIAMIFFGYLIIRVLTMFYIKRHGYNISIFTNNIKDFNLLFDVSSKYKNRFVKILHFFQYIFIVFLPIVLVIIFFSSASSENFDNCEAIEKFKSEEYKGIIKDKFIDKKDHYSKVVVIENKDSSFNIYQFSMMREHYYNEIQIGDSLIKRLGNRYITIKRDSVKEKIYYDLDCDYEKYKEELEKYKNN
jgi:hypothetical protein